MGGKYVRYMEDVGRILTSDIDGSREFAVHERDTVGVLVCHGGIGKSEQNRKTDNTVLRKWN